MPRGKMAGSANAASAPGTFGASCIEPPAGCVATRGGKERFTGFLSVDVGAFRPVEPRSQ